MHSIDVNELLSAFSLALDLAENKTFEHAQRTAYIALRLADELAVSEDEKKDIYAAALLHDVGLVNALADVHSDQTNLEKHCYEGSDIVKPLSLSPMVSENILWHHANWDGDGPFALSGNDIPIGAQTVYLADQLDLLLKSLPSLSTERFKVVQYAKAGSGKMFSPDLVQAFLAIQEKELFWLEYGHYNMSEVIARLQPKNEIKVNLDGMEKIAQTFAKIIDNKSPFTHYHSQGLSHLLSLLCAEYGFDEDTTKTMKISGLLHDLGKLAIPNEILDKPGKLTTLEFQLIKSHSYYTKLILSRVEEFRVIKEWAGNHHETLDGKGYPEGLAKKQLSKQERMVATCDVYQALTEERPYRHALTKSEVFRIMGELAQKEKICSQTFKNLKRIIS